MNSLSAKGGTILKTVFSVMILCAVMGFTNTAQAYDYRAKFIQECGWLATQQQSSGGIQEGEDYTTVVETDNTQEAI